MKMRFRDGKRFTSFFWLIRAVFFQTAKKLFFAAAFDEIGKPVFRVVVQVR